MSRYHIVIGPSRPPPWITHSPLAPYALLSGCKSLSRSRAEGGARDPQVAGEARALAGHCGAMLTVSALTAEGEADQHSQLLQAGHLVVATPGRIAQVLAPCLKENPFQPAFLARSPRCKGHLHRKHTSNPFSFLGTVACFGKIALER